MSVPLRRVVARDETPRGVTGRRVVDAAHDLSPAQVVDELAVAPDQERRHE